MSTIAEILGTRSQLEVLMVLSRSKNPIPLRQLAELAKTPLTSTMHAVNSLQKLSIVKASSRGNRKLISFRTNHPQSKLIQSIFELIAKYEAEARQSTSPKKAEKVLEFNNQALEMIRSAKRSGM